MVTGLVCWALAGTAYAVLRLTFGERPVSIHVRWAPTIDDVARLQLEQRYRLARPEPREDRTFSYTLTDRSRDNIRSLVLDPAVEDTHEIDRTAFRVGNTAPQLPYVTPSPGYAGVGAPYVPAALEWLIALLGVAGAFAFSAALAQWMGVLDRLLAWLTRIGRLGRRTAGALSDVVPAGSPESVALFRVVFGVVLLSIFTTSMPDFVLAGRPAPDGAPTIAHAAATTLLQAAPSLGAGIRPWLWFWTVLFVAGAYGRVAFGMITAGAFVWGVAYTSYAGSHSISVLILILISLLWAPWSDAWSLDAWRRARKGLPPSRRTPREYGYATWIPGFVLGVCLCAAAVAKLYHSGIGWITNGTIKYHFLTDSAQAPVDWGLQLGGYPTVAVGLSFGAVALEALVLVGVCAPAYRYRLATGGAVLVLLTGFFLFQGIFWPAWWVTLLSFLPWYRVAPVPVQSRASPADETLSMLRVTQVGVALVLVAQQVVVSAFNVEWPPLLSSYDMYATSYSSPENYEEKAGATYWLVAPPAGDEAVACRIEATVASALGSADEPGRSVIAEPLVRRCLGISRGSPVLQVEERRQTVDWGQWRLGEETREPLTRPFVVEVRELTATPAG